MKKLWRIALKEIIKLVYLNKIISLVILGGILTFSLFIINPLVDRPSIRTKNIQPNYVIEYFEGLKNKDAEKVYNSLNESLQSRFGGVERIKLLFSEIDNLLYDYKIVGEFIDKDIHYVFVVSLQDKYGDKTWIWYVLEIDEKGKIKGME